MTELYLNDLIFGISTALDYVEKDIVGVSEHHCRRIACITARLGRWLGYSDEALIYLAASAALHDNALTKYIHTNFPGSGSLSPEAFTRTLGIHCTMGEQNISLMPFYHNIEGAVLYHHERADGRGPFRKYTEETPVFARLIHIADTLDAEFDFSSMTEEKYETIRSYVRMYTGTLFDPETADIFLHAFPDPISASLDLNQLESLLQSEIPGMKVSYSPAQIIQISSIFSNIIDNKSAFTNRHSTGIAEKAMRMGAFYGWNEDVQAHLYLAGALHDVGKLMVSSTVLEKPGKLNDQEYKHIQNHAFGSYLILHPIRGLEELSAWAYLHHEKLDGSGYPFGRTGDTLNEKERLMACLDIYQALVEERPYKKGMSHQSAMEILNRMGDSGKLDTRILCDIDRCLSISYTG